jgi:1,5-anhydro-D-fructose reductase (1,5-anhydro-D-mannitol-forming)
MNTKIINWGIIGCGDVCEVKSGPGFQLAKGSQLVAVMRRNAEKAKDFAERHSVSRYYSNAEELINDPTVNAIYIATPPSTHAFYTIESLKAGKPVYVEKPMALTFKECQTMISASEKYNLPVFVAYYRRFFPYFLKIKELIDDGKLGTLLTVNLTTTIAARKEDDDKENPHWHIIPKISGGGYFFDVACHQLDILDFLLGNIEDVAGFYTNRAGIYEVEDTLSAALKFNSGVLGSCSWTYVGNAKNELNRIEITGTKGMISFGISGNEPIFLNIEEKEEVFRFEKPKHVEQPMIEQVTKSLLGKNELKSNMYSAARTSWVMDKIMGR